MKNFMKGFVKTAASKLPSWAHQMHKTMNPKKSLPNYSKKSLSGMLKRRGVK